MSLAFACILALVIAGIAYFRGYRWTRARPSFKAGWYGLGTLILLFAGLWASGAAGHEARAYGFGIALFLALPILLLLGLASVFGRLMRWWKIKKSKSRSGDDDDHPGQPQ